MLLFGQRRLETLIGGIANWSQNWIQASSLWVYAPPLQTVPIIGLINTQWLQACLKNYRECLQNCLWFTIIGTYNYMYHPIPSILIPENLDSPFWCVVQELDSQTRFQYIQDFSRAKRPLSGTTYKKGSYLIESYTHLTTNEGKIFVWEFWPWNFWPIEVKKLEKTNPIILRCKSFGAFPTFLVVFYSSCLDARCKITKISSTYFYYIAPGFDFCKQNIL